MSDKTKQELKDELDQLRQDALDTERRLLEDREALLDEMYLAGLRQRPTMLHSIESLETNYRARIDDLMLECERHTGRKLYHRGHATREEEELS